MDIASLLIGFCIAALAAAVAWRTAQLSSARIYTPQISLLNEQHQALKDRLQDDAARAKQRQDESAELFAKLDREFAEYRQDSAAKETTQVRRLADLTESLRTMDKAASLLRDQIPRLKGKIDDLQTSLQAEQGKHGALEEALKARADLAAAMTSELAAVRTARAEDQAAWIAKEAELRSTITAHEAALANESQVALKEELERMRQTLETERSDADSKLSAERKKLTAAEQRIQMLQREIMTLVNSGGASEAAATMVAAEQTETLRQKVKGYEKQLQELELKLAQSDSDTRKKLREAEYRVCELEFKLAEAEDNKAK
jgi:chromosome segregation ATPase